MKKNLLLLLCGVFLYSPLVQSSATREDEGGRTRALYRCASVKKADLDELFPFIMSALEGLTELRSLASADGLIEGGELKVYSFDDLHMTLSPFKTSRSGDLRSGVDLYKFINEELGPRTKVDVKVLSQIALTPVGIRTFESRNPNNFVVIEFEVDSESTDPEAKDTDLYNFMVESRPHISLARFSNNNGSARHAAKTIIGRIDEDFKDLEQSPINFSEILVQKDGYGERYTILSESTDDSEDER